MIKNKCILSAIFILMAINLHAQTIQVMKDGKIIKEYDASEVDSIVWLKYKLTLADGTDVTSKYKVTTTAPKTSNIYVTYKPLENVLTESTTICCNKEFELWTYNELFLVWEKDNGTIKYSTSKQVWYYKIPRDIRWFLYIK